MDRVSEFGNVFNNFALFIIHVYKILDFSPMLRRRVAKRLHTELLVPSLSAGVHRTRVSRLGNLPGMEPPVCSF